MRKVSVRINGTALLKTSSKFPCPRCSGDTGVVDTIGFTEAGLVRRRKCAICETQIYTTERVTRIAGISKRPQEDNANEEA